MNALTTTGIKYFTGVCDAIECAVARQANTANNHRTRAFMAVVMLITYSTCIHSAGTTCCRALTAGFVFRFHRCNVQWKVVDVNHSGNVKWNALVVEGETVY